MSGVDKLDNRFLGLSADGTRVIKRCPKACDPYDTLASICGRAPAISAKRRAEIMADDNAKKRKLTPLANRRGGIVISSPRQPEGRAEKKREQSAPEKNKEQSAPEKTPTVSQAKSPEAIVKKVIRGIEIEDLTTAESPPQPQVTTVIAPSTVGSDSSIPALTYRSNQWIERVSGRFPEEVLRGFAVPPGHSGDRWQPAMDVGRNESMITDDPMQGGNLGYRLLSNLTLPMDRPAGPIGPLAASHMHNLMKVSVLLMRIYLSSLFLTVIGIYIYIYQVLICFCCLFFFISIRPSCLAQNWLRCTAIIRKNIIKHPPTKAPCRRPSRMLRRPSVI